MGGFKADCGQAAAHEQLVGGAGLSRPSRANWDGVGGYDGRLPPASLLPQRFPGIWSLKNTVSADTSPAMNYLLKQTS